MKTWKITGLVATIIIVVSFPLYLVKFYLLDERIIDPGEARFVGRDNCIECHKKEYDLWKGSHHDLAMDVATSESVLGDFDNALFVFEDDTSLFFRKENRYFVRTAGPGGRIGEFEITHTFGVTPLQQYLIPFDGGRLQCLPIAWDTDKGKWFQLAGMVYAGQEIKPSDWLYWTNAGQNWNGMCAECHSTNLKKNYDLESETFSTTWSEIDVSCEACHGPGSLHAEWAQLPEMARPKNTGYGLVMQTSRISPQAQIELCAPCHSRRSSLGNNEHHYKNLLDVAIPQLISEPIYFADGQVLDEDYVYGSFVQSKMYAKGVTCKDCHDVHSGKRIIDGNQLCAQCHRADIYDRYDHHFHKYENEPGNPLVLERGEKIVKVGEGALCVNCHMPPRFFMGVDSRNDHSMRIPRPDLSIKIGVPNACNQCHADKSAQWSDTEIKKWYGLSRPAHFGLAFAKAGDGDISVIPDLIGIINEELYMPIVRASALSLLVSFGDRADIKSLLEQSLYDPSPLVRLTAVQNYVPDNVDELKKTMIPFLNDSIKAIRIHAANQLIVLQENQISENVRSIFKKSISEYVASVNYLADFPSGRHNLGNYYGRMGDNRKAEQQYRIAIKIDSLFFPAKVNLAMIYNRLGKNDLAEKEFRDIIRKHPEFVEAYYSLGLLLAEKQEYEESARMLEIAIEKIPGRVRIYYNLGLIYQQLRNNRKAEANLLLALKNDPTNFDYLFALADQYLKTGQYEKASRYAGQMIQLYPDNQKAIDIYNYVKQQSLP